MWDSLRPVLLGGDLNSYGMARAFYARYHVRSLVLGRMALGATAHARCLEHRTVPGLSDPRLCVEVLRDLAARTSGATRILLPGTDEYAHTLIEQQGQLAGEYLLPVPGEDQLPLFDKAALYRWMEECGIRYPETIVLQKEPDGRAVERLGHAWGYPYVVKPSSSRTYWQHPFPEMEKVYLVGNRKEAERVLHAIFASGYPDAVLAQRYIPGGDASGYVLTLYFDRESRVTARACGHVLLEERTPCGKGNYAALVTAPLPAVTEQITAALSARHYRGFANLDLRRDPRTGWFYVLEMNLRPGRSNHFLLAGGVDPARLLVEDLVLQEHRPCRDLTREVLWRTVPYRVLRRELRAPRLRAQADALHRRRAEACPWYGKDLLLSPRRALYVAAHMQREGRRFRRHVAWGEGV